LFKMMTDSFAEEYRNGPNQVIPVNNYRTWDADGAVKLRMDSAGVGAVAPISVPGLLARTAREFPKNDAVRVRNPKTLEERVWTWSQYHEDVRSMAKAFISLGLQRFESVCILGFNSPEWVIADLACIFAGALATGIYPTNGKEACKYILEVSKCSILVVEDQKQLEKIWDIRGEIPNLKKIIQYNGTPSHPGVLSWKDVMADGASMPDHDLEDRLRRIAVNQACTLIFTSGTTGNPKGVMLSHDNMTFVAHAAVTEFGWEKGKERIMSYLPLSHVAANMMDIMAPIVSGGTLYFADKDVLKSTLKDNLLWCKPTQFVGVPRVYEKIMEAMLAVGRTTKGMKKAISTAAKEAGLKYHLEGEGEAMYGLFQKIVYSKIKKALGLDQVKNFYSGAAPLSMTVFKYFLSLDMKVLELYGMSETTGPHTWQTRTRFQVGTVGTEMATAKTRLEYKSDDSECTGTEIWMWGRNIMMGYLNREDATRKDMTEDGWLKSGDLGVKDKDGFLSIVGREKDLIITAGGENIAPQPVHERVKIELPIVANALLLGDKMKFISCFLTLNEEINKNTMEPTGELSDAAKDWCRSVGSSATTVEEILSKPDGRVMAGIQAGIDRVNKNATSNAQRIQKWTILPVDFSLPGGELGPTMKVKRKYVTEKYARAINRIYNINMVNGRH